MQNVLICVIAAVANTRDQVIKNSSLLPTVLEAANSKTEVRTPGFPSVASRDRGHEPK